MHGDHVYVHALLHLHYLLACMDYMDYMDHASMLIFDESAVLYLIA